MLILLLIIIIMIIMLMLLLLSLPLLLSFLLSFAIVSSWFFDHDAAWTAHARPSTAGPLREPVLAVAALDRPLLRAAVTPHLKKPPTEGELHD